MSHSNGISGKVAVVTGASRGIGAATAAGLAKAGASRIVVHYNSYPEGVEAVLKEIQAAGSRGEAIQADLSTIEGIDHFVARLDETAPEVDILINNAGSLVKRAPLSVMTDDLYDQVMNLNVRSAWRVAQAVAPGMIAKGSGVIVFLSSIAARNGGGPGATIYAASKAAISCITKGVSKELAPKGIRVNAVSPGTVDNHFHEVFSNREILDNVIKQTPCGRLATNEDCSDVIVFLCSEAARYVHGQTIEVNGGMYMV